MLQVPGFDALTEVGRGGFGVVYRASQPEFDREVAIKVLSAAGVRHDDQARRRFATETATTGRLSGHPHIITVHQAGFTEDGVPYLVMPFLREGSLGDRLRDGPMGWREAVPVGIKIAGALATAHQAGIVHRDVKPDNILIDDFGAPVLSDFGIATVTRLDAQTTTTGPVTGTIAYSPPEAMDGQRIGPQGDVFGLAATLFALIAGHAPFVRPEDESFTQVVARMAREDAPGLGAHGVPEPIAAAIARALARRVEDRTPTMAAFGESLQDGQRAIGMAETAMVLPRSSRSGAEDERTLALPVTPAPVAPGPPQQPGAPSAPTPGWGQGTTPGPGSAWVPSSGQQAIGQGYGAAGYGAAPATPAAGAHPAGGWPAAGTPARGGPGWGPVVLGLVLLAVVAGGVVVWLTADGPEDPAPAVVETEVPTPATTPPTAEPATDPPAPATTPPTVPPTTPPPEPPPTPTPTPTPTPAVDDLVVAVASGHPDAPAIADVLQQWASGITNGDHDRAWQTYTPGLQDRVGFQTFTEGNATSTIESPSVITVEEAGPDRIATITFRSRQDPSQGPSGQACTDWRLEWTLVPAGGTWQVDASRSLDDPPIGC